MDKKLSILLICVVAAIGYLWSGGIWELKPAPSHPFAWKVNKITGEVLVCGTNKPCRPWWKN